jgi:ATP-binding cassette subfamily F protein 3
MPDAHADAVDPERAAEAGAVNRKQQRQLDARRRQALKPLSDRVKAVELGLAARRAALGRLEARLADPDLYNDPARKEEIAGLMREQGDLRSDLEALETDWLDASEALERAALGS